MKNLGIFIVLLLGLVLVYGSVYAASGETAEQKKSRHEKLAVFDLEAKWGVENGFAEGLSIIVRDTIYSFGVYEVMSQADLQAVAGREQLRQVMGMGCDDGENCLINFGRNTLGTRYMVAGAITKYGSTYTISLRMLDTKGESAGLVNRVSESCKCSEDALIETVRNTTAKLIGKTIPAEQDKADALKAEAERQRLAEEVERLKKEQAGISAAADMKTIAVESEKQRSSTVWSGAAPGSTYTDPTTGMEFVYVKEGCYQMGQSENEKKYLIEDAGQEKYDKYFKRELPRHEVCVDGFYMGRNEVTLGQWRSFINSTNYRTDAERDVGKKGCYTFKDNKWGYHNGVSWDNVGFSQSDSQPAVCVSYNDVNEFIVWLNKKGGRKYRLPTEAEWEYAARGGTSTMYYWGDDNKKEICKYANHSDRSRDPTAIYKCDDGYRWTSPVGSFLPNSFGLYDMSGNAWEWCSDWYDGNSYSSSPRNNPQGVLSGSERVVRGGGWNGGYPWYVRTAYRIKVDPGRRSSSLGFRLVFSEDS